MRRFKAYWRVFATSAREDGANPSRVVSAILQLLARVLLMVAIYRVAYQVSPNPGLSFQNTMWSIGVYFVFVLALGIRDVTRIIDVEIKAGNLETALIKPLDWRLVKLAQLFGKSGLEFLLALIIIPGTLFLLVGPPDLSFLTPQMLALHAVLMIFSVIVVASLFTMVGLTAVWTNDAMSAFRIIDKAAAVFSGAFVPIALLPGFMQEILRWSPFGVYAAPQQLFNPHLAQVLVPTFISGIIWSTIMVVACQLMWRRVGRRLEVNGG